MTDTLIRIRPVEVWLDENGKLETVAYMYVCNKNGADKLSMDYPRKGSYVPGSVLQLVYKEAVMDAVAHIIKMPPGPYSEDEIEITKTKLDRMRDERLAH